MPSSVDLVERALAEHRVALTREIRAGLRQVQREIGEATLQAALARGPNVVAELVRLSITRPALSWVVARLKTVVQQSGARAYFGVTQRPSDLQRIHPSVVRAAEEQAARLVTGVTRTTRAGIRQAVIDATRSGSGAGWLATELRAFIGLTPQQARSVATYRAALVKSGMTGQALRDAVAALIRKKIRQRAQAIAETELADAANGGTLAGWRQALRDGELGATARKKWLPNPGACPACGAMAGQTRKLTEYFSSPKIRRRVQRPPLHTRCRCAMGLALARR